MSGKSSKIAWWVAGSLGILFFALMQAGIVAQKIVASDGDEGIVIATVIGLAISLVLIPFLFWVVGRRQRIRLRVLRQRFPNAVIFSAVPAQGFEWVLQERGNGPQRRRDYIVALVDETGVGLWKGARKPVRFAFVPVAEISGVVREKGLVMTITKPLNVVSLLSPDSDGYPVQIHPAGEGWRASMRQTSEAVVDALCDRARAALGIDAEVATS